MLLVCAIAMAQTNSYQLLVRQAVTAMEDDSLRLAEQLFRQALKESPQAQGNVIIWSHLASIAERTGREDEAMEDYRQALLLAPGTTGLLLNRASLYLKMGNESRALADYNEVLDKHPDHAEALKDARRDYEHLLRLDPNHEQALLGLALVNDNDRRPQEAMENINRVIDLYPTHAAGYAIRAGMEFDRKLYEVAEVDYSKAIEIEPENISFRLARAHFYNKTKRKKEAREDVRVAARLGATPAEVAGAAGIKPKK